MIRGHRICKKFEATGGYSPIGRDALKAQAFLANKKKVMNTLVQGDTNTDKLFFGQPIAQDGLPVQNLPKFKGGFTDNMNAF